MEYFLCRAMEIGRLTPQQIDNLHNHEKKERILKDFDPARQEYKRTQERETRCLMPFEIQEMFGLPSLKEYYQIPPEDLNAQAVHNQRLRGDFRRAEIYPKAGDVSSMNVEAVHLFDQDVLAALADNKINLYYMGPRAKKRDVTTEIGA